jgi:uncharacterized protein (TIGR03382 family)
MKNSLKARSRRWPILSGRVAVASAVVGLVAALAAEAPAAVVNSGFDTGPDGLAAWKVVGSVYNTGEQGVLSDDPAARSMLWQNLSAGGGPQVLQFDLLAALAGVGGSGTLPDTFFVSLYSFPSPVLFDPVAGAGFSGALAVLDLDSSGITAAAPGLQTGPSPKGPSYLRVAIEFTPADVFIAPVFDLQSLNFNAADSVVVVDNVTITAVPECGVAALAAWGLLLGLAVRRRR